MKKLITAAIIFFVSSSSALCQCSDSSTLENITDNVLRTSGNQIFSFSQSWVSGDYASLWTVYAAAQITQNSASLHSGSDTEGSGATAQVYWYDTLETVGPGTFAEADQHRFTNGCGTNEYYPYNDRSLTVSRPTISTPGGGDPWGAGYWAIWYMNGLDSPGGFLTSAVFTATTNLGDCGGCTPTYLWENPDNPSAINFSSDSGTSTTLSSARPSSSASFDTSVNFSVDGFYAASKIWLNLNTPRGFNNDDVQTFDDGACGGYGSYDSRYQYVPYDMWNYAIGQITVNEKNDDPSGNYAGPGELSGWFMAESWVDDDNWPPDGWDDEYHLTDHLEAADCGAWNPHTASPSGLSVTVFWTPQTFYVGSAVSGTGVDTAGDDQHFYTDHGEVTF